MRQTVLVLLTIFAFPLTLLGENCGAYFNIDYLYWKASQEQLIFGVSGVNGNDLASFERGEYIQPGFSWNSGFKVGAGYYLCDCWNVFLQYTRYSSTENRNSAEGGPSTTSTLIPGNSNEELPFSEINGNWKLYFNVLDLELGRAFAISKSIMIRPFVGLKAAWQKQRFKVELTRLGTVDENRFIVQRQIQDNWGIGLRGGFYTAWQLPCTCWSLFSNLALSTIWTDFDTHRFDLITDLDTGTTNFAINADYRFYSVDAVVEMQLGFRREFALSFLCSRATLQAGYEAQIWINHGQMLNLPSEGGVYNGDLYLHGLTLRVIFDF